MDLPRKPYRSRHGFQDSILVGQHRFSQAMALNPGPSKQGIASCRWPAYWLVSLMGFWLRKSPYLVGFPLKVQRVCPAGSETASVAPNALAFVSPSITTATTACWTGPGQLRRWSSGALELGYGRALALHRSRCDVWGDRKLLKLCTRRAFQSRSSANEMLCDQNGSIDDPQRRRNAVTNLVVAGPERHGLSQSCSSSPSLSHAARACAAGASFRALHDKQGCSPVTARGTDLATPAWAVRFHPGDSQGSPGCGPRSWPASIRKLFGDDFYLRSGPWLPGRPDRQRRDRAHRLPAWARADRHQMTPHYLTRHEWTVPTDRPPLRAQPQAW